MASIYIDVELSEFDEDDLIDELTARGFVCLAKDSSFTGDWTTQMYLALVKNDKDKVMKLASQDLYDRFGKIV